MSPVVMSELVSTFRANRVSLQDEHSCSSPPSLGQASNTAAGVGSSQKRITAEQGDVVCTIEPDSVGARVRRVHYSGDEQTWVDALNVECAVFPSDASMANTEIEAVERSLRALVRLHPKG
jgi:hypothetical protein